MLLQMTKFHSFFYGCSGHACMLWDVQLFATPWPITGQAPLSGIFQGRILEWVAISYSCGSSQPKDWTHISCVSCIGRQILYHWATWEAQHGWLVFCYIMCVCIYTYIYLCPLPTDNFYFCILLIVTYHTHLPCNFTFSLEELSLLVCSFSPYCSLWFSLYFSIQTSKKKNFNCTFCFKCQALSLVSDPLELQWSALIQSVLVYGVHWAGSSA